MFFFSSRRRHTRWPRDWSSDVCSSDLAARPDKVAKIIHQLGAHLKDRRLRRVKAQIRKYIAAGFGNRFFHVSFSYLSVASPGQLDILATGSLRFLLKSMT